MINRAALLHRTSDNFVYPKNNDELVINLKTGKEIESVKLVVGDPFSGGILGGSWKWNGEKVEMPFFKELENHKFWTIVHTPKYKRAKYMFILNDEYVFLENGVMTLEEYEVSKREHAYFTFPWLNPVDVMEVPAWVLKTVWYQIFPDRFHKSDAYASPKEIKAWHNGKVSNADSYGGNLKGVTEKLEYLHDLGITGIYTTPIFHARSNHKYDTTSYFDVDPQFGTNEDLKELVEKAHSLNIKIMLDFVFNHCGPDFSQWMDVCEKGEASKYFDWFMINQFPFSKKGPTQNKDYYAFAFAEYMPKLNTNNPEVQDYLIEAACYWIGEYDIDGLRIDVANEVSHEFNYRLRKAVKVLKNDVYILGEIWHDSISWLRGEEFDSVMNYPLSTEIKNFFVDEKMSAKEFETKVNRCYSMYFEQVNVALFNLLDSHDTIRITSLLKNTDKVLQALAINFILPGSPCIYYGTELALKGQHDPDCRRCMPWEKVGNSAMYDEVKKLIKFYDEYPIEHQYYHVEALGERCFYIERMLNDEGYRLYINAGEGEETLELTLENVLIGNLFEENKLAPNGYVIERI